MTSVEIKQARSRRTRNSLDRQLILNAAHEQARSGRDISLRGVASTLECSAMAIYRYFPDKESLLLGLLDRVIGSIDLQVDSTPWSEQVVRISFLHLEALRNNSWAIPLLFRHPDPGPGVREFGEVLLRLLKNGGFKGANAVTTFASIIALNYGWAGFTSYDMSHDDGRSLVSRLGTAPETGDGLTETAALWSQFSKIGSNQQYEVALRRLLSVGNSG